MDRRIGLIDRLTTAITDFRHTGYIKHTLRDLLTQRIFQIALGYEDGNDSNTLRCTPCSSWQQNARLYTDNLLASGATFARLEDALSSLDIYCMARVLVL